MPVRATEHNYGRKVQAEDPDSPGSLGIAISEAVEAAATSGGAKKYGIGSVLGHVLLHQTVIGLEALDQMEMAGEYPDIVIACAGGGSNFAGFAFPFLHRNLHRREKTRVIAVEPASCPSLTKGRYTFDYGDSAAMAPVVKMHTLGHTFIPPGIHAGGLRYHGMAPSISALVDQRRRRGPGGEADRDIPGRGDVLESRRDHPRPRIGARDTGPRSTKRFAASRKGAGG